MLEERRRVTGGNWDGNRRDWGWLPGYHAPKETYFFLLLWNCDLASKITKAEFCIILDKWLYFFTKLWFLINNKST
jgi:hypothetical protein